MSATVSRAERVKRRGERSEITENGREERLGQPDSNQEVQRAKDRGSSPHGPTNAFIGVRMEESYGFPPQGRPHGGTRHRRTQETRNSGFDSIWRQRAIRHR